MPLQSPWNIVSKSELVGFSRESFLMDADSFAIRSSRSETLNEARTDIYISVMFTSGFIAVFTIIITVYFGCKDTTIFGNGKKFRWVRQKHALSFLCRHCRIPNMR